MKEEVLHKNVEMNRENAHRIAYACECGKIYDNFPALYLHFQRKHKQKISTKINEGITRVENKGNLRTITYLIHKDKIDDLRKDFKEMMSNFGAFCEKKFNS